MTVIPLRHHGERRGYNYESKDYIRNRFIATFIFGGVDLARGFLANCRGAPRVHNRILMAVLETCSDHRELVKAKQVITIEEWAEQWKQ